MSVEANRPSGSNEWEKLTPDSDLLVNRSVILPDPPSDIYNPATFRHPMCNPKTGEQGSIFASEIIEARMQHAQDHPQVSAKPRPMGQVW